MHLKKGLASRARRTEAGIALLISIFILLLISVVAIALIVSSGTESALAGNYRSSTAVYYAALSGLEEGRSRLRTNNPSSFKNTSPGFLPPPGATMAVGSVAYVLNPNPAFGENQGNLLTLYPDTEYNKEFGPGALAAANAAGSVQTTPSVWNTGPLNAVNGNMAGPLYKWVRINPVSEISLNLDVDADGRVDSTAPIYYNAPRFSNSSTAGQQVFEITSLAVLPDGTQKLLQYLAVSALRNFNLPLSSLPALTIAGSAANGVAFSPPTSSSFFVSGVDLTTIPSCTAGPPTAAIGVSDNSDITNVVSGGNGGTGIPGAMQSRYAGSGPPANVVNVSGLFGSLQTPSQFDALAQSIIANADVSYPPGTPTYPLPTVSGSTLSAQTAGMSFSNPMTVVINGNLDLTGWHNTGYGLLLVTGNLNYDPDASWQGMVMVIGQGTVTGSRSGSGELDGALFVAKTRDALGNLFPDPNLGRASVVFDVSMSGNGIRYNHCLVQNSVPSAPFKILSFHEISQ